MKVIDVYASIFKRIGCDTLAVDLPIYASGLFPLLSYASMQVRPILLDLYEEHLLFLGGKLIASLDGVFLAILPGLEENMEQPLSRRFVSMSGTYNRINILRFIVDVYRFINIGT